MRTYETAVAVVPASAPAGFAERLLDITAVADLLNVPVSWCRERLRKDAHDRLPALRLGKYWRFRRAEVLAWIDAREVR